MWILQKCSCFERKTYNLFLKTALLHIHLLLVPNLYLSEKYEIVVEKCHIFNISVALNINFYKVKSSRDTTICRKVKFQGVWTELIG